MANENIKEIKTRIALRTGDYTYWTTGAGKDIELLKGEVCVCTIAVADNQAQTAPTVLLKICDVTGKKFGDLKWTSALAADVYEWAKAANIVFENEHILFKNAAGGTIKDLDLSVFVTTTELATELAKYYTKTEIDNLFGQVVNTVTTVTKGTGIDVTDAGEAGDHAYTVALDVEGAKTALGLKSAAYVTVESLNATAKEYADAVENKLPTSADYGVLEVKGDEASGVVVDKTDAQRPIVKIATNTYDSYGAASGVQGNLTAYENAHKDDYTNTKIDELIQDAKDYANNNDANTEYHVEYDSTNKKIKLVTGADASKMEIDATDFIKDGMINSVELVQEDGSGNKGQFLKLTWNDDGNDITYVPINELVDIYTGSNGTEVNVAVSNQNVISASLNGEVATKITHGETAYNWGNHASAGYAANADLAKVIDGTTPVAKATDADTLDGHDSTYFATSVQGSKADTALQSIKVLGQTLTKDANEITVDKAKEALGWDSKLDANGWATDEKGKLSISGTYDEDSALDGDISIRPGEIRVHEMGADGTSVIDGGGISVQNYDDSTHTRYGLEHIQRHVDGGNYFSIQLPIEQGTLALTKNIKTYTAAPDGGLKLEDNAFSIDDSIVFVLDCNW